MRLAVTYEVDSLPVDYRMLMISLVKEALRQADPKYYEKMYIAGGGKMKPFSTAVYLHRFVYEKDRIKLDAFTLTLSSPDMEFMLHLFNGLQQISEYKTDRTVWRKAQIRMVQETDIVGDRVWFRTLSPILIEDRNGKPLGPEHADYAGEFSYFAEMRIRELTGREPYQTIVMQPGNMRKQIVKERNSVFRQQVNSGQEQHWLYYTAYQGTLKLEGHPEDLKLLYQAGVGKRASQSFGLLEVVREEG
ncbi:CRISPR-associated endoribonuclease Cas6 [Saccharibacillus sp. CPCC 101409]|uniref:CRISPR-associated endoribonuclease Cas6 n=1 Tax=Saccharibacillus sp. CPCC 101409 TaxID=3058041 RepID=UPI002671D93B|nr:CRISPR-associated endoribonuclease Cas6 [Saccharibacillus sp. CPCC 101409]MDO3413175.1 CRISPR-associated endoribonuclease Cas6 [Saccharibacillus sp. CPCC 101409]